MFDYVFVTHLPSFYKINLYNELAKKLKIAVIFVGRGSNIRNKNFTDKPMDFPYYFLTEDNFENRNIFASAFNLISLLKKLKFKKIVVGGWDLLEFWLLVFMNKKTNNMLALESGAPDSVSRGVKSLIKKIFLHRISGVFASGASQKELLEKLGYKGDIYITKGVGLINRAPRLDNHHAFEGKFLYIGRLSEEKNLARLLRVFNGLPQFKLSLVGAGLLEAVLKSQSGENINFINHVDNEKINEVFSNHDVFVLPSLKEPWGLVVEEALYFGRPVIISDKVGCGPELVKIGEDGLIFDANSDEGLKTAIIKIVEDYPRYFESAQAFDLDKKDEDQVGCYVRAAA